MTKRDLTRIAQLMQAQMWAVGMGLLLSIQEWLPAALALVVSAWFGYCAYEGLQDDSEQK